MKTGRSEIAQVEGNENVAIQYSHESARLTKSEQTLSPTIGSGNQPAPDEDNFRVPPAFAPASEHDRLPRLHQDALFVLRDLRDQRLTSLRRVHGLPLVRIIKDRDDAHKPVRGLENDVVFPNEHFWLESRDHAFDAEA